MDEADGGRGGHWEPTWEPPGRTTSRARRTSADKRLAVMPGGGLIRTTLNAIQATTDQQAGACSGVVEESDHRLSWELMENRGVELADAPVRDVRPLLTGERADFLALLASFGDAEWAMATEAGRWTVKDVTLHLLDDELGWLSRGRDNDRSGLLDDTGDYRQFVAALDVKNQRWGRWRERAEPPPLMDLLEWSGRQIDQYYASLDLREPSKVIWAGPGPVLLWFDLARDFTERWVHQQQIRDAVQVPGRHDRFLPDVLRTFMWAFPYQYRAEAAAGTMVQLDFGRMGGSWILTREARRWVLDEGTARQPAAILRMAPQVAWRQLTGLTVSAGQCTAEGDDSLIRSLLAVRGITV